MKYIKSVIDGYITAVCKKEENNAELIYISDGYEPFEIIESEYNNILSALKTAPHAEGKGYKLKTDLTWEEYDLPLIEEEDLSAEETLAILTGEAS